MLHIKSIPAFNDNYIWLIENSDHRCAVVDPGDAAPVLSYLTEHELTLEAILITHHHHDHIGGVAELVHQYPNVNVVGPTQEPIPTVTHPVQGGDQIELFDERFMILDLPGHTLGHIGYIGDSKLFCGDVLFSAGCGRVFEGTMEQMFTSLSKLQALPGETEIYCAHEYTASNVAFAMAVEPDNEQLQIYRDEVIRLRAQGQSTLPTTLRREKWINPFLRTDAPSVMKSVANRTQQSDPLAIFTALREWKNEF
ncbi:hydroxyacylglutathione hydrolase [Vibrio cincinnatiensis]|jgi:hydroxyacylglutathione hydrolase|uniref:Hydroxyacylglutathione hydrolase n=1 Tax=Vibrio cincinnatiensis DSM 19608 TaxID=1123491 RepID=A0A1T4MMW7_VIBCI|nr:hydroxyacylglutathione hydrolase [Vibrio cincinnatiensis]MCG3722726.1 hydroxyacylglutathione hydrolase [Vibrio cincinnatiensis]MCG3726128.1 hydroxyacylglutathione hydrolase [Vibrio cincinnatiensis]MCG3736141.1 hydroxyacylglutathione hydrolase [Vibrio cincinnatiensis]MCG3738613.1 hydroxyacylglutathione hydrolase [Vibrio cincinnatiensis]MCG3744017.1 hydroxyacylglutathione hydrolase [Vibrio cincinnatiensis]